MKSEPPLPSVVVSPRWVAPMYPVTTGVFPSARSGASFSLTWNFVTSMSGVASPNLSSVIIPASPPVM